MKLLSSCSLSGVMMMVQLSSIRCLRRITAFESFQVQHNQPAFVTQKLQQYYKFSTATSIQLHTRARDYARIPSLSVNRDGRHGAPYSSSLLMASTKSVIDSTTASDTTSVSTNLRITDPVILFDGVCNFCNTWVDVLLRLDVNAKYKFTPLQSATGQRLLQGIGKQPDDISSVVLIEPKLRIINEPTSDASTSTPTTFIDYIAYDKSRCVLRVVEELGILGKVLAKTTETIVPLGFRDSIYDMVAENRYNLMGKRDICRSGDPQYFDRFISE